MTTALKFEGISSTEASPLMSYKNAISPEIRNTNPSLSVASPTAVEVHPSIPATPLLQ